MSLKDKIKGLNVPKKRTGPLWEGPESSGPNGGVVTV